MANYKLGPVIGKIGGGGVEVQEWYYYHPSSGVLPADKENPVIAKVEEATPEEPVMVLLETNMRDQHQHNQPWEAILGTYSGDAWIATGKRKYAFFATEPGELRLTSFDGHQGSGLYHARAYICRLSDYAPV